MGVNGNMWKLTGINGNKLEIWNLNVVENKILRHKLGYNSQI